MGKHDNASGAIKPVTVGDASPRSEAGQPKNMWQWLLVYPSLAVAVLGAVPTYLDAIKSLVLGVPIGTSAEAQEQNGLWQKNFDCPQKHPFTSMKTKQEVEIASIVCDSGDVLLSGKRPDWEIPRYRWVSAKDLAPNAVASASHASMLQFISSAEAAEAPHVTLAQWGGSQMICQRWVGNGMLLQRFYSPPQGCYDQVINTYNGMVVNRYQAPCSPQC
jgi:hypothetical protein